MAQLRHHHSQFAERNTAVVIAGPENQAAFARYWKENDLPFIGLPDPNATILKLYGQEVNLFKLGRMPAQVLVDRQGIVRLAHYGHSMSDIPPVDEILKILDNLPVYTGETQ